MQPQKIGIGGGKVYPINKTRNHDEKALKTATLQVNSKIMKNKAPILAQLDNSKAMFRKMSTKTHSNKELA